MPEFIVIGENIHTSRVIRRRGARYVEDDSRQGVVFIDEDGHERLLEVPEWAQRGQDYEEGRIKHVRVAVEIAMRDGEGTTDALAYLEHLVARQEQAGAAFLDVNVDEISPKLDRQREALVWLIERIQSWTTLPVSVDSSSVELLAAGLASCDGGRLAPLLNSASLERLEGLDLAVEHDAAVVVTAAGEDGMPEDDKGRIANIAAIVDAALTKGISEDALYVDPLIFPIAVDGSYGGHALDAIRATRATFGDGIHITGGFSNVSFGLPARGIINDAFLHLAIEAGADSGIVDPVSSQLRDATTLDTDSPTFRLAEDVLMGRDEHCATYINAWRRKELEPLR